VECEFIDAFLVESGCPAPGDGQQAQIERIVAERLADTLDEPPDERAIRRYVADRIERRQREIGGHNPAR
jgi:hypothetical protein